MPAPRVYLAGPDVFLADAFAVGATKKAICEAAGLEGVFPLDIVPDLAGRTPDDVALAFFDVCVQLMDTCDGAIANMTPFRGPSMDVGTAVEIGYIFGRAKAVFGYTADPRPYAERVDGDGLTVENFGQVDNLMCPGVVRRSGFAVVVASRTAASVPPGTTDLSAMAEFERCVEIAAAHLLAPA